MKIRSNSTYIDIVPPDFGYSVLVRLALNQIELQNKQIDAWDNGKQYDTTILKIPAMFMNKTDAKALASYLTSENTGRTASMVLDLESDRGVYPAGPHHGDSGTFNIKLINRDISGILEDPYWYFKLDFEFTISPISSYSLPSPIQENSNSGFSICGIDGLRYPPEGFNPKNVYSYSAIEGLGNNTSGIDTKVNGYKTSFDLVCNQPNAANVCYNLLNELGRSNTFQMNCMDNYYPFGVDNGLNTAGESFNVKLAKNEINIVHRNVNEFELSLNFGLVQ